VLRRIRGAVISTEAIVISAAISIVVFFAFWFLSSYLMSPPKYVQGYIDAEYCGTVLTVKNTGSITVRITYIVGVKLDNTAETKRVSVTLDPGQTWVYNGAGYVESNYFLPYRSVSIVGENFASVTVRNECA